MSHKSTTAQGGACQIRRLSGSSHPRASEKPERYSNISPKPVRRRAFSIIDNSLPRQSQRREGKSDQMAGASADASATLIRSGTMKGMTPNCQAFSEPISVDSQA